MHVFFDLVTDTSDVLPASIIDKMLTIVGNNPARFKMFDKQGLPQAYPT
jgi:hypothetical protein